VVLEAVLHTDQLADVRRILQARLGTPGEDRLWQVTLAANELVTNALLHAGGCVGLRVFWDDPIARVEVDDPSPVRLSATTPGRGLGIVDELAAGWGDQLLDPPSPRPGRSRGPVATKTVWCEIRTGT
jgi:two-component sensor histidine kinase